MLDHVGYPIVQRVGQLLTDAERFRLDPVTLHSFLPPLRIHAVVVLYMATYLAVRQLWSYILGSEVDIGILFVQLVVYFLKIRDSLDFEPIRVVRRIFQDSQTGYISGIVHAGIRPEEKFHRRIETVEKQSFQIRLASQIVQYLDGPVRQDILQIAPIDIVFHPFYEHERLAGRKELQRERRQEKHKSFFLHGDRFLVFRNRSTTGCAASERKAAGPFAERRKTNDPGPADLVFVSEAAPHPTVRQRKSNEYPNPITAEAAPFPDARSGSARRKIPRPAFSGSGKRAGTGPRQNRPTDFFACACNLKAGS
ncbi:hypothetical protein [uncultured Alistipes sp.]|uniref:hypothetical protein n=1 Tax=uncultured Alistipes sp. TaxID=538949 RepID=UPI00259AD42D|nr:hypothetical protein [uncultured Alistipes sp.]